jgi:chaperonin GroEL (HSP60 family)
VIIRGYKMAATRAREVLAKYSREVGEEEEAPLLKIAMIAIGSKNIGDETTKTQISKLIIKAVKQVMERGTDGRYHIDHDYIKVEKKAGGSVADTQLINGVLIDKEVTHPGMPRLVSNAKIALLDVALEIEKTETDAKIEITSPEQMEAFLQQEERMLKSMVEKIKKSGANVVFTQKGIDDVAQHYLSKEKIMAARRIKKSDIENLARATGAKIVTSLDDLSSSDLGYAGTVEERKISGEQMLFVEKCKDPKSVGILVRGGNQQVVDEYARAIDDVIGAVSVTMADKGRYVLGGGSIEIDEAEELRNYSGDVGGREQLAIQKFADALEAIPKALADNSGMDAIDILVRLRSEHKKKEGRIYGVDVNRNAVGDMVKAGVFEPTKLKEQALDSASEAAEMVLRIDDIISSKGSRGGGGGPPGGMPGGMGGME